MWYMGEHYKGHKDYWTQLYSCPSWDGFNEKDMTARQKHLFHFDEKRFPDVSTDKDHPYQNRIKVECKDGTEKAQECFSGVYEPVFARDKEDKLVWQEHPKWTRNPIKIYYNTRRRVWPRRSSRPQSGHIPCLFKHNSAWFIQKCHFPRVWAGNPKGRFFRMSRKCDDYLDITGIAKVTEKYGESHPIDYEKTIESALFSNCVNGTLHVATKLKQSAFPFMTRQLAEQYMTCRRDKNEYMPCENAKEFAPAKSTQHLWNKEFSAPSEDSKTANFTKLGELFCRRQEERENANLNKIIHNSGRSAQVKFEIRHNPGHYTGIFKNPGEHLGLLRFSFGQKPEPNGEKEKVGPNASFGLKIFRDKTHACDLLAMFSFEGQKSYNILRNIMSNNISDPVIPKHNAGDQDLFPSDAFQKKLSNVGPKMPGWLAFNDCAKWDVSGNLVEKKVDSNGEDSGVNPRFPWGLVFVPNPILSLLCEEHLNKKENFGKTFECLHEYFMNNKVMEIVTDLKKKILEKTSLIVDNRSEFDGDGGLSHQLLGIFNKINTEPEKAML